MIAEGSRRLEGKRFPLRAVLVGVALSLGMPGPAAGEGLISGGYTLNWDQTVDKTGTTTTDTGIFRHTLDLKYKGFLSPIVENEITLKVEQEVKTNEDPPTTTRIFPAVNLGYKGSYWNAGAKRTIEESSEPDTNTKVADSYFVEFFLDPPRRTLPDFKGKYTIDQDFESGTTDTTKQAITLSSVYRPMQWIELKGDYQRNLSDDDQKPDSDTEDETISGTVGIRHFLSDKIRVNSEFKAEISRGATLLDAGGATNKDETQKYTWKNTASFRPFRDTNVDGSYDYDLDQNIENGEHTFTTNWKAAASHKMNILDLKGDFTRAITETRHTDDDNEKTEDTWTAEARVRFSKHLDFTARYQKKDTEEIHFDDPSKDTTSGSVNESLTWTGEMTPFWKASASYDKTDTVEKEITTTIETRYSFKSTFDFKPINLTLDPTYDITETEDLQQDPLVKTDTKDFKFKIAWTVFTTNTLEAKIDHTYGRKTDSGAGTIERTDDSNGTITWKDAFPGWNLGFDFTRSATDTSEDDLPPDITSTFGFKADYSYEMFNMSTSYKYDMKRLTDDSETFDFKIGWKAPQWDVSLSYSFDRTFSEEQDKGYSISLAFAYKL